MKPEKQVRQLIDEQLAQASWVVQNYKRFNLGASVRAAIRESPVFTCTKNMLAVVNEKEVRIWHVEGVF